MPDPAVYTNSSIGSFGACPHRYWWAYQLGLRREEIGTRLSIGTAYHAGLEALNRGGTIDSAVSVARAPSLDDADRERVACLVAGWQWRWSNAPAFRKILAVEKVFEFKPIRRARWSYAGKIDVIGELEDGRIAVGENKTTTDDLSPGSDYWRRLQIDRQISGYILGARSLGFPASTVLYDAARLPGLKPKLIAKKNGGDGVRREDMEQYGARIMESIAEKPDWYYRREEVPRLDAEIEHAIEEIADYHAMIQNARKRGRWPRNTDACRSLWGRCRYFGPCADSYNPETQGIPNGFRKVENVHAELTVGATDEEQSDEQPDSAA